MVLRVNSSLLVALPLILFAASHGLVSYSEFRSLVGSSAGGGRSGGGATPSDPNGNLNSGGVPTVVPPIVSAPAPGLGADGNHTNLNVTIVPPALPPVPVPESVLPYGPETGGADHYAHAKAPELEPQLDEDGDGKAMVILSSGNSHTHLIKDGKAGQIIRYTWSSLTAGSSPEVNKVLATGSAAVASGVLQEFPVGQTPMRLEVEDNGGNKAHADFNVEVVTPVQSGAYCYFYKGVTKDAGLPLDPRTGPRPTFAAKSATVAFSSSDAFPSQGVGADGSPFAQRCVFALRVATAGPHSFALGGKGAFNVVLDNQFLTMSSDGATTVTLSAGVHPVQVLYFGTTQPQWTMTVNGAPIPESGAQWDMRTVVPIMTGLSPTQGSKQGGTTVVIEGVNFFSSHYTVTFGPHKATKVTRTSPNKLTVETPPVPEQPVTLPVTVSSKYGGASNSMPYTYDGNAAPVQYKPQMVTQGGPDKPFDNSLGSAIALGPDGRLYIGKQGFVHVLTISQAYEVTASCKSKGINPKHHVLSLAFNPADVSVKLYAALSIIYYNERAKLPKTEWNNGMISLLEPDATCMAVTKNLITGLPVSDHDHAIGALTFDQRGRLRMSAGSFTNMGSNSVLTKGTGIGGLDETPLSAALLVAPINEPGFDGAITWACDRTDPSKCKQSGGMSVKIFASGVRNCFGMLLHSNGFFYATDNGPNNSDEYGKRSTSCTMDADDQGWGDKLLKVTDGANQYFGHPNRARGQTDPRQCVAYKRGSTPGTGVTKEAFAFSVPPSHNGVVEIMSNIHADAKHSIIELQSAGKTDSSSLVSLNAAGDVTSVTPLSEGGLLGATNAHGAILMTNYFKNSLSVLVPQYTRPSAAAMPFLIAVHPHRGRAGGGNTVVLGGHNFGATPTATFGGRPCTNVRGVAPDGSSFTCTTPAGTPGAMVKVEVTAAAGRVTPTSPGKGDFWYMEV
ncbi:hypothetical protein MMPV_003245 [Pyropia vietnamensis]